MDLDTSEGDIAAEEGGLGAFRPLLVEGGVVGAVIGRSTGEWHCL
jgi:hypothetical protein